VYRHRDYGQCSVFSTGVLLIKLLRHVGGSITFTQPNKNIDANWWGVELSNFNKINDQSQPMLECYEKTGVDHNCKVTHQRTQAVLIGGSKGLNNRQITSFTKHTTDKFHTAYLPDCEETAMKVMCGFRKVSKYMYLAIVLFFVSDICLFSTKLVM
jgi:hypothetical protein